MGPLLNNFADLNQLIHKLELEIHIPTILDTILKVRNCMFECWRCVDASAGVSHYTPVYTSVLIHMSSKAEVICTQKMWEIYPHLVKATQMVNKMIKIAV